MPNTELSGASVRVFRAIKDYSQTELAEKTGLSQTRICQIEHDRVKPTPAEWAKILGALTTE